MALTHPLLANRKETALCALLAIAIVLPVAFLRTPPFIDVLGHMGRFALQTKLDDAPWLHTFYTFQWQLIGNLGADLILELLHPLLGVVGATRLVVALVPLLACTGVLLLSREVHGRVTPFAVAALALIYGLPFTWGFLNFSLAMALALLAFVLWLRIGPARWRPPLFACLSLLLWLCHTFGWAFLGLLCTADSLARHRRGTSLGRRAPDLARDLTPLLAPLVPMLLWRSTAASAGIEGWFDFAQKADWLVSPLRLQSHWFDVACAAALLGAIVAGSALPRFKADRRLAYAAAIAFFAFLLLPKQIFGSVFADMRLAPYAVLLGLLAFRDEAPSGRARASLLALALAFLALRLTLTGVTYHQRERSLDAHLEALQAVPEHARLAMLVEVPCQSDWSLPWFSHIGSVALTRREVFVNDQWANASMNPLQVHIPAAGAYATDDRQLVFPPRCGLAPTLRQALGRLPMKAFTHVWIVGVRPAAIPRRPDLQRVWRRGDAAVFRVVAEPSALPKILKAPRIRKLSKLQP